VRSKASTHAIHFLRGDILAHRFESFHAFF
jgi:hypothetical protein